MSSTVYINQLVRDIDKVIRAVFVGKGNFDTQNPTYQRLRRRLESLSPLIGPPPDFIKQSPDLWTLWGSYVKHAMPTYQERRDFLDNELLAFYTKKLSRIESGDFVNELLNRDICLLDEIGEGGYGVVYEADHLVLEEKRAVKKLEPVFSTEDATVNAIRRFSREAAILHKIHDNNIVRIFDAGIAGRYPYIIMEYIEGQNLAKHVQQNGVFDQFKAKDIMVQIASAISSAHKVGVIHRDLKPSNIMFDGDRVVVLDFGAGQWIEHTLSTRITTTAVGTVGYIADELHSDPLLLNKNLDCYSLGVIYHFLLTGRTPNTGNPKFYMDQSLINIDTQNLILKAMGPSATRHADAKIFFDELNS